MTCDINIDQIAKFTNWLTDNFVLYAPHQWRLKAMQKDKPKYTKDIVVFYIWLLMHYTNVQDTDYYLPHDSNDIDKYSLITLYIKYTSIKP